MSVTILIVDDSKLARIVATKALAELQPDWQRLEANSAADALDVFSKKKIDVALIDFNMADKDGLELAAELRQSYPDLPIAIITANIQDEVIARAREIDAALVPKRNTKIGLDGFVSGAALRLRSKSL
jgi:CheY-like chemotaxis protein